MTGRHTPHPSAATPLPPSPATGEGFGAAAARLAGAAARLLGWRPDEFWGATPMELASALGGEDEWVDRDWVEALRARFPD